MHLLPHLGSACAEGLHNSLMGGSHFYYLVQGLPHKLQEPVDRTLLLQGIYLELYRYRDIVSLSKGGDQNKDQGTDLFQLTDRLCREYLVERMWNAHNILFIVQKNNTISDRYQHHLGSYSPNDYWNKHI
jgi:hypothetical protein